MEQKMEIYEDLRQILEKAASVQAALALIEWDNETLAPKKAGEQTAKTAGALSGIYYDIMTGPSMDKALKQWKECGEDNESARKADGTFWSIDEIASRMCCETEKERRLLSCVPREEYEEFTKMTNAGGRIWAEARKKKDFSAFAPELERIIEYKKKLASYRRKDGESLYDAMLDEFEENFPEEKLDEFFGTIREELVPFLEEIRTKGRKIDGSFLYGDYPEEKQEKLARMMAEYIGFDFERGVMAVSEHPFTTSFHNKDVRITTHYDQWLDHSLFSVIHEGGHALYELGIDDRLTRTILGQGASMAMHESQSRFMENIIGRSQAFWEPLYGKVQELFPDQLGKITLEHFIEGINQVQPGLIRINADELTYSLHIMVRYDLEKGLMNGKIRVSDLENEWADRYEAYLGLRPKTADQGVLQDIHWSQGSFGYFPSYALGSAFAAQIYEKMKESMDVDGLLKAGQIHKVTEYLRGHIHRYGRMKDSLTLIRDTTGEDFSPRYYIRYLKEKYGRLYL